MKRLIRHLCVLFQHFKNTSLPTNVYVDDFCAITASGGLTVRPVMTGTVAKKAGQASPELTQAFIRTSDLSEQTLSLQLWHPFLSCLYPKHTTSSLLLPRSSLIYIFHHRKRDLLWWQHFARSAWSSQKHSRWWDMQQSTSLITQEFL